MSNYRKLNDIISIDDSGLQTEVLVNGQWAFTLPDGLIYEANQEFDLVPGGISLTGSTKPLVIREAWSIHSIPFRAAVTEHYSFTGEYYTATDCKYDERFNEDGPIILNSQKILIDSEEFYVDLTSVDTWPFGIDCRIRVRGNGIAPFNIEMMFKPDDQDHWDHIAQIFKEIAFSVRRASKQKTKKTSPKKTSPKKKAAAVSDPNCIMDGTVLLKYIGREENITLPEGITELADSIFSGRNGLRSITLPKSLQRIGRRAFENCFALEEVIIPGELTDLGHYAFVDCHKLKRISLGNKLTCIPDSAFSECYELENVVLPESLKIIDAFAFKNCRKFTKIVIPEGTTTIGYTAFSYCTELSHLYIPDSVTKINDNLLGETPFGGCGKLTIHCAPGSCAEQYAREHGIPLRTDLSSAMPSSAAKASSDSAVKAPKGRLLRPDEYSIENGVLTKYKGAATDIIIPDCVTSIGHSAFEWCENLTSVTIPSSVFSIGEYAFATCKKLTSITIPDNVTSIGHSAFADCEELTSITIPDSVTSIGRWTFFRCEKLISATIPGSVTSIGDWAFPICGDLTIIAPEGSYAHRYAESKGIRFRTDTDKKENGSEPSNTKRQSYDLGEFDIDENGTLTDYRGSKPDIILPDAVTAVGTSAFNGNQELKCVTIPHGVTSIGSGAFQDCVKLTSITIPDSVTSIGVLAFSDCENLVSIEIFNGITVINDGTFFGCTSLRNITVPDSVISIGDSAFAWCEGLRSITISESVTAIAASAFNKCNDLTIIAPEGSFAQRYAKTNGIPFREMPPEKSSNTAAKAPKETVVSAEQSKHREEETPKERMLRLSRKILEAQGSSVETEAGRKRKEEAACQQAEEAERKRKEEEERLRAEEAERKRKEEVERKRKEEEAERKRKEEAATADRIRQMVHAMAEEERKRKAEAERKRKEEEERLRAEEAERKRKEEVERKRKEEEAERKRKEEELAARRALYGSLAEQIGEQTLIISRNRGWFGTQARLRKTAKQRLAELEAQLAREFPNGKP